MEQDMGMDAIPSPSPRFSKGPQEMPSDGLPSVRSIAAPIWFRPRQGRAQLCAGQVDCPGRADVERVGRVAPARRYG